MDQKAGIERYWTALAQTDGTAMAECYADDATFQDPIFKLRGHAIGAMWRSLMDGSSDLRITTTPLSWDGNKATGTWTATYTFRGTGRKVTNRIRSTLQARDGLIIAHRDRFPFWRWSRMALGAPGLLLGWTPMLRRKVQRMALRRIRVSEA